ncbi:lipoprotein insertase outer membrane protein LolB [Zoogloea sp. 1C4]|uniref:lipoprotein insertase outer membrane protein LolB n=1 Tax=Zoogloea sp. 1C4 TaxID=2570190 RepID=UPI0012911A99|nr:lipoprotein insertase outer membrane protein LolB [Zoogloea sp. 1C4]
MKPAVLMLALGLVGCAAPALRTPPVEMTPAAEITRFAVEGRLQVRDAERSAAVGFDWQHDGPRDEWLFTGPLGQGLARIESDASGARMTLSDGRRFEAASAAELAGSLLGVEAPFANLPRWVTARPGAGAQVRTVDTQGRPRSVVDQGWTIDYTDYTGEAPDALPRKLDVHRGDTRLRLIVDAWNP